MTERKRPGVGKEVTPYHIARELIEGNTKDFKGPPFLKKEVFKIVKKLKGGQRWGNGRS